MMGFAYMCGRENGRLRYRMCGLLIDAGDQYEIMTYICCVLIMFCMVYWVLLCSFFKSNLCALFQMGVE